jgi:hypothetical protein
LGPKIEEFVAALIRPDWTKKHLRLLRIAVQEGESAQNKTAGRDCVTF